MIYSQGCRRAVIDRVVLLASVTGGVGIVFGILEVSVYVVLCVYMWSMCKILLC